MMMKSSTVAALAALFISSASAAPQISTETCYDIAGKLGRYDNGTYSAAAVGLAYLCAKDVKADGQSNNIYKHDTCVAAATANSLEALTGTLACNYPRTNFNATSLPHLNFNVYASIVGKCARHSDGCPITPQNYIDFIYSQIDKSTKPAYPDLDQVLGWWKLLTAWTATGESVPYKNFDDWLHYSQPRKTVTPIGQTMSTTVSQALTTPPHPTATTNAGST